MRWWHFYYKKYMLRVRRVYTIDTIFERGDLAKNTHNNII